MPMLEASHSIPTTQKKKLFRDQFLATKWNNC